MAESIKLDIRREGFGQYTSSTCWYACYRMMFDWKKDTKTNINEKLAAAGLDVKALHNRGLLGEEFVKAGVALGFDGLRASWIATLDLDWYVHLLKKNGPLWCAMEEGHAVLLGGVDGKLENLIIYNPYNRTDPGNVEIDYAKVKDFHKRLHTSDICSVQVFK